MHFYSNFRARLRHTSWRLPWVSLFLGGVMLALHLFDPSFNALVYAREETLQGQWYRLFSSQLVHFSTSHVLYNLAGLLCVATVLEQEARRDVLLPIAIGMIFVAIILPQSHLQRYCGFSGALNALVPVLIWRLYRKHHSVFPLFIGVLYGIKLIIEPLYEISATNLEWPTYHPSHYAGLLGGIIFLLLHDGIIKRQSSRY